MMKKIFLYTVSLMVMAFFVSCTGNMAADNTASSDGGGSQAVVKGQSLVDDDLSAKNILQVAIGSKDHTTLVAGVQAADLEDVLVNAGPLTVFAPVNSAFDALPEGVLADLLKPENKSALAGIIKFHAAPGKYTVDMLKDGMSLFQASGHYVKVTKEGGDTFVAGCKILGTVEASNGIVHVVDKVMLPPE
jgi:uncharacterized surface protein with fasciclin (FAS1) repeats